jgi:hypothetical protein
MASRPPCYLKHNGDDNEKLVGDIVSERRFNLFSNYSSSIAMSSKKEIDAALMEK